MLFPEQILIFLGVLVATGLLIKWRSKREKSAYRYPPSLPSLPLVGSLPFVRHFDNIFVFFMEKSRELGPIFTLRFGSKMVLILNSKDVIEKAYVRNSSTFSDRPELVVEEFANPENKGVGFETKKVEWKKAQQLSLSILKEFGLGVKSIMETRILQEIEDMTNFIIGQKGETFNPKETCMLATSNIIMNILVGRRRDFKLGLSETAILSHKLVEDFNMTLDVVPFIRFLPHFRQQIKTLVETSKALYKSLDSEITKSLDDTVESSFVQSYIQKVGPNYDRAQLNYVLRDLVGAGSDTSGTILQWSLVVMANNPAIQKRLQADIDAVVAGNRFPTLQDQTKLPFVEATILELTRWRSILPLSVPRSTSENSIVDGYFIPAGVTVISNLYAVHNDINLWKDPEVFRPERFLDEENNVIGKEKIMPFSVGRRSCLGETLARAELFLIFTSLVKRFVVLPPEGQDKVTEDHVLPVTAVLYPAPFKIRLIERK